ncbi:MAG: hypothetical protein FJ144_25895 [Deltaproteobacteria bacterium]|nr:hypothetical protein [Deltaproteobacteria bacterium]
MKLAPLTLPVLLSLAFPLAPAQAETQNVAISRDSTVVVSIAASAEIYRPGEFPVTGRNCGEVLDELRTRRGFAGVVRQVYEPPADGGQCFNLEGEAARVAVVCCAPADAHARR